MNPCEYRSDGVVTFAAAGSEGRSRVCGSHRFVLFHSFTLWFRAKIADDDCTETGSVLPRQVSGATRRDVDLK